MPHGGPDWGTTGPLETIYTVEDMAELAVRLGSIDTFDRRGNIIWLDDFGSSLNKWSTVLCGGRGSIAISAENARNGAFSVKFVTGNVVGDYVWIAKPLPYTAVSKLAFEISFTTYINLQHLFRIALLDGTTWYLATVIWDAVKENLACIGPEEDEEHEFATDIKLHNNVKMFQTMKLVADFPKSKYARFIFNQQSWDLSAYPLEVGGEIGGQRLLILYKVTSIATAVAKTTYADCAIITQNEP